MEGKRQKLVFSTWNEAVATTRDRADWRTQVNFDIVPEESQD